MRKSKILEAIEKERARQDVLHPCFFSNDYEGDLKRLSVLMEEIGEIAKALNEMNDEEKVDEIIQATAVLFRWLEQLEEM